MFKQLASLVVVLLASLSIANSQPLFTYGNKQVTKEEFLRAFNKNPTPDADRKAALKEYLDLYINFKLKVRAASDAKMQDDPTYIYETENFKKQLADNFINEEANIKALVNEAFNRMQKDIHLEQVFIEFAADGDTAAAYKQIQQAYAELKSGKTFDKVSNQYSPDANSIDLGYITLFSLPYEYENIIYGLKPGGYSPPVRSASGYHIFRNSAERPAAGSRKAAQILFTIPPGAGAADKSAIKAKADSVYRVLILNPNKFDEMVHQFSNDISTAHNHGMMQEFGVGQFSNQFESIAFALKKGEISEPFETNYGFHILQMIDIIPVAKDMEDPVFAATLKDRVEKDNRLAEAKKLLVNKWLKLIRYQPAAYDATELWAYTDSFYNGKNTQGFKKIKDSTVIFSFAKQKLTAADFAKFVKAKKAARMYQVMSYADLMKEYVKAAGSEYYRNHLEDYNTSYKHQVNEFNEANLLFAIMDQEVWNKAGMDEEGLKAHYEKNKAKYIWAPSADAIIVTAKTDAVAREIRKDMAPDLSNWRKVTDQYANEVLADSSRYELNQIPVVDRTAFAANLITAPVNNIDGSITFAYILKVYNDTTVRSFDEARGLVINDYQSVLETNWLNTLKKKYPVKVNQAVFNSIK